MQGLKHLYLVLLGTFMVGFVTGVYVFFLSGGANNSSGEMNVEPSQLEIIVDAYGGCDSVGCASYRILEDGSYTFIQNTRSGDAERYEGELSDVQFAELTALIDVRELAVVARSSFEGTCPVAYDGNAYRFQIHTENASYTIDSCKHDTTSVALLERLIEYLEIFTLTHESET